MQLDSIRLRNFRSILDSGPVRLRPVTLLLGPNGAGKSSLLHAVAMLKQTLESADGGVPLVENGRVVELGSFREFVYRHETSRLVAFELRIGAGRDAPAVQAEIDLAYSVRRKSAYLRRFAIGEPGSAPLLSVNADGVGKVEHAETAEPPGAPAEPRILGTIARSRCLFRVAPAWGRWGAEAGRPITEFARSPAYYDRVGSGVAALEAALAELVYLGPDREPLSVVAHVTTNAVPDVGARGENAAALLHAHRYAIEEAPAVRAVAAWLERLGIGDHLRVIPVEEHLYEVTIEDARTGFVMNLWEAGRTVCQLFPLLVQSALAAPAATLLLEEPEAHLHPRLQHELVALLVETAGGGRRLLIETYSEPLVRGLQEQVRDGTLAPDDLGVYFAEKVEGDTQFTEVPVEPDGKLANWPADFWRGAPDAT